MQTFLFDTNVFIYFTGVDHPYRKPCQEILGLVGQGKLSGEASVELAHEFAHYVLHKRREHAQRVAEQTRAVLGTCSTIHPFTSSDLELSLKLVSEGIKDFRDAVFVATAQNNGIKYILSADKGFDQAPGIKRIDPIDPEQVLRICG